MISEDIKRYQKPADCNTAMLNNEFNVIKCNNSL